MINLGQCISFLLDRHGAVPVAGLGTFQVVQSAVEFDAANGTYQIPPPQVSFTADPDTGSGLIADFIAAQRQIDAAEAGSMFRKAIAKLLHDLETNGQILLDDLGIIRLQENLLIFEPQTIDRPFSTHRPVPVVPVRVAEKVDIPVVDFPEPTQEQPETGQDAGIDEEEETSTHRWGFWSSVALIIGAVALVAAGFWWFRPDLTHQVIDHSRTWLQTHVLKQQPAELIVSKLPEQTDALVLSADSTGLTDTLSAVLSDSLVVADQDSLQQGPAVTYEIIVGSFATMQQANKYVTQMKAKGINLHAIDSKMPGNRKKISYGSYTTEAEAYRVLSEVQRTLEPTAWVARVER